MDSVVDIAPYNSRGNQFLRTLLSAKVGSNRWMLPLDGYLKPLHHTLETVLRGFASITNHPDRRHQHKYYTSILQDIEIWILDEAVPSCDPKAVSSSSTNPKLAVQPSRNLFSWSQIRVPLN